MFYKSCRASITKYRQQSRKVKAKLIGPKWSQVCSFLLQFGHTGSAHFWLTSFVGSTFSLNGHCFPLYFLTGFVQFNSVAQSFLTLCDPMNCSTPGLAVHHQLLESTQTHVHQVSDAIQQSHPLSSLSLPALNLSQHLGSFQLSQLFASGAQSIGVSASTSVPPMNTQD